MAREGPLFTVLTMQDYNELQGRGKTPGSGHRGGDAAGAAGVAFWT
jgi:hypothetical protein